MNTVENGGEIWYQAITDIELVADNPCLNLKSQKVTIYNNEPFSIRNKQKDMFDSQIEYWMNRDCWIFKITPTELQNLERL